MTVAGLRSNLIPPFALADEVLVNRDGTTGRQTVDKFALQLLSSTAIGSLSDARQLYPTRADLPAASGQALRFSAVVFNDPDGNNNGTWSVQLDNMGAKAWLWAYPLQFSVIRGFDEGDGSANAIKVSTSVPVADGIFTSFRPFRDSGAGLVTVSFNADEPLIIRDAGGSSIVAAGSIKAGVTTSGFRSGDFFDLITDIDAAASAASAASSALAAQETANAFSATLSLAVTTAVEDATEAASDSAAAAGDSETLAGKWASENEDVAVSPGKFSAFHWAQKAFQTVLDGLVDLSVTTAKLANGALSANAAGRAKMQDGFLTRAKFDATTGAQIDAIAGRNLIINGQGRVNQRAYVSGAATTGANQFTLDRWFVVTSGQNLSFTGNDSRRVMTAPAGGVSQVVEGSAIVGGNYVLNWTGTATATVNGTARTKGEVFVLPANTNATVRFSGGTFTDVQLELSPVPTAYERLSIAQEISQCHRYYEVGRITTTSAAASAGWLGTASFKQNKRATPTMTKLTDYRSTLNGFVDIRVYGATGSFTIDPGQVGSSDWSADAELTS